MEVLGKVEGVSHRTDGGGVLLEKQLEGGVLEQGSVGSTGPVLKVSSTTPAEKSLSRDACAS